MSVCFLLLFYRMNTVEHAFPIKIPIRFSIPPTYRRSSNTRSNPLLCDFMQTRAEGRRARASCREIYFFFFSLLSGQVDDIFLSAVILRVTYIVPRVSMCNRNFEINFMNSLNVNSITHGS